MPSHYRFYLLRQWAEDAGNCWRYSLEDSRNGERIGFADLAQLTAYLAAQTGAQPLRPEPSHPLKEHRP